MVRPGRKRKMPHHPLFPLPPDLQLPDLGTSPHRRLALRFLQLHHLDLNIPRHDHVANLARIVARAAIPASARRATAARRHQHHDRRDVFLEDHEPEVGDGSGVLGGDVAGAGWGEGDGGGVDVVAGGGGAEVDAVVGVGLGGGVAVFGVREGGVDEGAGGGEAAGGFEGGLVGVGGG